MDLSDRMKTVMTLLSLASVLVAVDAAAEPAEVWKTAWVFNASSPTWTDREIADRAVTDLREVGPVKMPAGSSWKCHRPAATTSVTGKVYAGFLCSSDDFRTMVSVIAACHPRVEGTDVASMTLMGADAERAPVIVSAVCITKRIR